MKTFGKLLCVVLLFALVLSTLCACAEESKVRIADLENAFELTFEVSKNGEGYTFAAEDDAVITGTASSNKKVTSIKLKYYKLYRAALEDMVNLFFETYENGSAASLTGRELDALGCYLDYSTLCETFGVEVIAPDEFVESLATGNTVKIGAWNVRIEATSDEECDVTFIAEFTP